MFDEENASRLPSCFYGAVKNEIKGFANVLGILDKVEFDNNLVGLGHAFGDILDHEIRYALGGALNRAEAAALAHPPPRPARPAGRQHAHFQGELESHHCRPECAKK